MNNAPAFSATGLCPDPYFQQTLADRILDTFPSGSYALSALFRLMDIVESTGVPTAAVECHVQPRLLINPDFVARQAHTPERLLMLVMHELHHVLLGHTTLFPRITKVQNFVFDAVINGVLCRMFPSEEHTAFFTDYYSAESYPECLLRPPPGWPAGTSMAGGVATLPEPQRAIVSEIHAALYSETGASYAEVFDALPKVIAAQAISGIPLLGGHDGDCIPDGGLESRSTMLFDIVRSIVEQWPQPPDPIRGRSLADVLKPARVEVSRAPSNRRVLRSLIRKVAGLDGTGGLRRQRTEIMETPTPLPNPGRRALVQRSLGHAPLLHAGPTSWRHPVRAGERVHVYLDVSGSMDAIRGPLYGAVLDCEAHVHPVVHLFSTKVADISLRELRRGACESTGGTDIGCVAEHMAAQGVRRAVLVTDGWVGTPRGSHHATLVDARLAVAYLGASINEKDLRSVVNHTAFLSIGASS